MSLLYTSRTRRRQVVVFGRTFGPRGALLAMIGLSIIFGCKTPEQRYRTLSFFFDGVPLPESMRPADLAEADDLTLDAYGRIRLRPPVIEWVVHEPECDECPSSKKTKYPYAEAPELCWDCHDPEDFEGRVQHGPFAAGACLQCHSPHKSRYEALLVSTPSELCANCHDTTTFAGIERHLAEEGEDCIGCHNPHAAPEPYMLQEEAVTAPAASALTHRLGMLP